MPRQKSCKLKLHFTQRLLFCIVGGHSCVRLRLLLVVTRLIVIVACLCSRGHPDTDLVYIIIIGHMDISDGPFNKPLLGKKNIRFTPTNSSNPILMAHSCGLGGKYWYKHTKVFQTEHLKRLVQCGLETWLFFPPVGWQCQICSWHAETNSTSISSLAHS